MGKFIGWLGGILAVVIGGWLVWYLTRPPSTTTFEGMVINGDASAPVPGAMVSIEIKSAPSTEPYHDFTDDHGSYRLDFTGLGRSSNVTIQVTAKGFQRPGPASIGTVALDNRRDFVLTPLADANPPSGPGAGSAHLPAMTRPAYIQKTLRQAVRVQLQARP
jgi:hypothetical protein